MKTEENPAGAVQAAYLADLRQRETAVAVYLVNGVRLVGTIESYDLYVLVLRAAQGEQMIYKHAISTVIPFDEQKQPAPRKRELL